MISLLLQQLRRDGVSEITLAVGHRGNLLEDYIGDGSSFGLTVNYQREQSPLGTAGPLGLMSQQSDRFLVCNGDVLTTLNFAGFAAFHRNLGSALTLAVHQREWSVDLGVVEMNGEGLIGSFEEKPVRPYLANMGIYMAEPRILDLVPENTAMDFPTLIDRLISMGEKVGAYKFDGYFRDVGRPEDYQQAQEDFKQESAWFLTGERG